MLSLVLSFLVLLWKACPGLLQDLNLDLCGSFFDFQPFGLCGSLGHASGLLRLFFFLSSASLIFSRAIHAPFSECAILLSFDSSYVTPMRVIFVNDGWHLYTIYCNSRLLFITSELYYIFRSYIFTTNLFINQLYYNFTFQ